MPQAGLHGLLGIYVKRIAPKQEWLLLGIILGGIFPDMDNVAVAIATLARLDTAGLHRTFTHSVFTVLLAYLLFWAVSRATQQTRWLNFGAGFATGIVMHILLDFVIWFNGVNVFWPLGGEINFWRGVTPPAWLATFLEPAEFLCFALFLLALRHFALKHNTDANFMKMLTAWIILEGLLFVVFTPLAYSMTTGYHTLFGAAYLFSLFMTFGVTIRLRETVARLQ